MMVKTGKEREEIVQENLKSEIARKTERYQYLLRNNNKQGMKPRRHIRRNKG